jgi:lipoate-protein ligase A
MQLEIRSGTAAQLHAIEPGEAPEFSATWNVVTQPALVLGSTQPIESVDAVVADERGIEIVRRRSGGGSVLMLPGEMAWLDVVVPRNDPRWSDDVGRAMWWLGDVWVAALADCGVEGTVHRGALHNADLGRLVCFASRGAGEVVVAEHASARPAKLVGISQRRTRAAARLQSSIHLAWRPDLVASLLTEPAVTAEVLAPLVAPVTVDAVALHAAVERALGQS